MLHRLRRIRRFSVSFSPDCVCPRVMEGVAFIENQIFPPLWQFPATWIPGRMTPTGGLSMGFFFCLECNCSSSFVCNFYRVLSKPGLAEYRSNGCRWFTSTPECRGWAITTVLVDRILARENGSFFILLLDYGSSGFCCRFPVLNGWVVKKVLECS